MVIDTSIVNDYRAIIENQIATKEMQSTTDCYEALLNANISEESIKDFLEALMEVHIQSMAMDDLPFDETVWNDNVKRMQEVVLCNIEGKLLSEYQMEKNISRIRKDIGYIQRGEEDNYLMELCTLESSLFSFRCVYGLKSIEARKIVLQLINRLYGFIRNERYDMFTENDKKYFLITDLLEEKCNPYMNDDLYAFLEDKIDLKGCSEMKRLFAPMIKCLERIYQSMLFWEKKYGSDGYFIYLDLVQEDLFFSDPTMAFTDKTLDK